MSHLLERGWSISSVPQQATRGRSRHFFEALRSSIFAQLRIVEHTLAYPLIWTHHIPFARQSPSPFPHFVSPRFPSTPLCQSDGVCQHIPVSRKRSAGLQEGLRRQEPRQRLLVYVQELLSGHPAAADAASECVSARPAVD